jgi:hypothetical protein
MPFKPLRPYGLLSYADNPAVIHTTLRNAQMPTDSLALLTTQDSYNPA